MYLALFHLAKIAILTEVRLRRERLQEVVD